VSVCVATADQGPGEISTLPCRFAMQTAGVAWLGQHFTLLDCWCSGFWDEGGLWCEEVWECEHRKARGNLPGQH